MKQFFTILKFELMNFFKNKVFVGITAFLVAAIVVVMFLPQIMGAFEGNDSDEVSEEAVVSGMILLSTENVENADAIRQAFAEGFPEYEICAFDGTQEELEEKITSGEAECAFVMTSATSYEYYVNNLSMYDSKTAVADEILYNLYTVTTMLNSGMTQEQITEVFNVAIHSESISLGKDQAKNFFYTYIMIFALYMVILLYGQMVATNVATEKSSRAMELLVTSAKPVSMMFGKVIASCLAGFIQILVVFGSAIVCFNINKDYWGDNMFVSAIFNMPVSLFIYMLIFFVLGFFIYAFLFGAIGSMASKVEDINTSSMPLTMLFVAAFLVVMFSMTDGNVDSVLMKVCSYIPFTSPMAMFTRIAMSTVPFYEIVISIVILVVSVIGVGVISAKIYRVGVLLYGTTPKFGAILKAIKKA